MALHQNQYQGTQEFVSSTHVVHAENGQDIELFLKSGSYANIAGRIKVHDKVEVIPFDNSFYLLLFVVSVGQRWVKVETIYRKEFEQPEDEDEEYFVQSRGPAGWCVVRKEDNSILFKACGSQESAIAQMIQYSKTAA